MKTNISAKIKDIKLADKEQITLTLESLNSDQLDTLRQIKKQGTAYICFSSSQADMDDEDDYDYKPAAPRQGLSGTIAADGSVSLNKEDEQQMSIDDVTPEEPAEPESEHAADAESAEELTEGFEEQSEESGIEADPADPDAEEITPEDEPAEEDPADAEQEEQLDPQPETTNDDPDNW